MWTFLGRIAELALDAYKTLSSQGIEKAAADLLIKKASEAASHAFAETLGRLIAFELDAMAKGSERVLEAFTPPRPSERTVPILDLNVVPWDTSEAPTVELPKPDKEPT
jgi:hypothetical protein